MIPFINEYMFQILTGSVIFNIVFLIAMYGLRVRHIEFSRKAERIIQLSKEKVECRDKLLRICKDKANLSTGKADFMTKLRQGVPSQPYAKYRVRFDETWEDGYLNGIYEATKNVED